MNTLKVAFIAIAAIIVALAAFVTVRTIAPPSGRGVKHITIAQWGQEKYLIYLPVYIAQEKGFFRNHGLDVSITFNGNDDQVFATVARGDAQFGVGDPIFAAISRQRGFDGIVVASIVDRVALWGVTKTEKNYTEPKDFSNTSVGTFPRPSTTYTLVQEMIDSNHIPGAQVIEIAIGNELALLESGKADVVMLLEPAASLAESKGYHVATSFPKLWGPFAFTGLTTTETYRKENPELVENMRSALADSLKLAHSNPAEAVSVAQKLFPSLDPKVLDNAVKRMVNEGTIPFDVDVSKEGWLKAIEVRKKIGDIKSDSDYMECIEQK